MIHTRPWFGVALAFTVAGTFAAGSALAGLAFRHGTDPLTVTTVRTCAAALTLFVALRVRGSQIVLPRRARHAALALGSLVAFYSWSLYQAVSLMPVALAVLTFYLYPLMTGVVAWTTGRERFTARAAGALGLAFLGLALALNLSGGTMPAPLGIAFALAAAFGFTAQLVLSSVVMARNPPRPVTVHMLGSAAVLYALICVVLGHFRVPDDAVGWLGLGGTTLSYVCGAIGLYTAIALLGPVKSALVLNIEPVYSMVFGYLLLGQTLTAIQIVGAALVVGGITLGRAPRPAAQLSKPATSA
ncbi:MAG TPA: DMT family transporter [Candidatus Sulfotelmatobacter sp.]|nr:DMT family transporter [Candidatus Sulfotelmatobacter sp.]